MSQQPNQTKRICLAYTLLLGVFLALVCRLAWIQLYDREWFQEQARQRQDSRSTLLGRRGPILDRCNRVLAESVWVDSACADPSVIRDKRSAARILASALAMSERGVLAALHKHKRFTWIKRFLSDDEARTVRQANLRGVFTVRESKRVYPLGRVAAHVVGFCSIDGKGLEGVEALCNSALLGSNGYREVWRDGARRGLILPSMQVSPPKDGRAVVLTLDSVIQSIVYQELTKVAAEHSPEAVFGIVMDCNSGAVLAMVDYPSFCPDRFASGQGINPKRFSPEFARLRRNRAITDVFEPGSILKPFVASAAFELGVVKPEDVFYCHNGSYSLGHRVLHDAHGFGDLTAREVLIKSSNIGIAQIAQKAGKEVVYQYLRRFGFGKLTGFDLPGESYGTLRPPRLWQPGYSLPSIAMGQEISASPLRIVTSFCALGNGGVVPRPYVVGALVDQRTGKVVWRAEPGKGAVRAIRYETSRTVLSPIMCDVVKIGTGHRARQDGYTLGGKTGTAQLLAPDGRGYAEKSFFSSFVALAPMEAPRICVGVMVVKPKVTARKLYYGGGCAAPAVGRIAKRTLLYMGVKPRWPNQTCKAENSNQMTGAHASVPAKVDPKNTSIGTTRAGKRSS